MFGGMCHYTDNFRNYSVISTKTTINIMPRKYSKFLFDNFFYLKILDWGSSSALFPLEAQQPVWLIVRFPVFLNVPNLTARCLSRPQPAVVP